MRRLSVALALMALACGSGDIQQTPGTSVEVALPSDSDSSDFAVREKPEGTVAIRRGCFEMGSAHGDPDEQPVHQVCVEPFHIDAREVTYAQWAKLHSPTGLAIPSNCCDTLYDLAPDGQPLEGTDSQPVVDVSWSEAHAFCAARGGRLPTEAEWEYAARGGLDSQPYPWGAESPRGHAVFGRSWQGVQTLEGIGDTRPNDWQLYDMAGGVWEWTGNHYDAEWYVNADARDRGGPRNGLKRVVRGGAWFSKDEADLRVSNRFALPEKPSISLRSVGFRCVFSDNSTVVYPAPPRWDQDGRGNLGRYVRADGTPLGEPAYWRGTAFVDGTAWAQTKDYRWVALDEDGKERVSVSEMPEVTLTPGHLVCLQSGQQPDRTAIYRWDGTKLPVAVDDAICDQSPAKARTEAGWGLLDASGEWVLSPRYERIGDIHDGRIAVATGSGGLDWKFVDVHGKDVERWEATGSPRFAQPPSEGCSSLAWYAHQTFTSNGEVELHEARGWSEPGGTFERRSRTVERFAEGPILIVDDADDQTLYLPGLSLAEAHAMGEACSWASRCGADETLECTPTDDPKGGRYGSEELCDHHLGYRVWDGGVIIDTSSSCGC